MGRLETDRGFDGDVIVSNYSAPSEWGDSRCLEKTTVSRLLRVFPIIPPQVNGATPRKPNPPARPRLVSNYSAPSEWGDGGYYFSVSYINIVSNYSAPSEWGDTEPRNVSRSR